MKKAAHYNQARDMYVRGQMSFETIAGALPVSDKTLRNWGTEGKWAESRAKFVEQQATMHERLYNFTQTLMDKVEQDLADGETVNDGRMYVMIRLIEKLDKLREYEHNVAADKNSGQIDDNAGLSDERIREIEKQLSIL